jgi:hypothetical protein
MDLGGYFELELSKNKEYHNKAIKLNTGRNALEYILLANNYAKIYIPYYTCNAVLQPINKLSIKYEFYNIDSNFLPIFDFKKVKKNEAFIFNNYNGILNDKAFEFSKLQINLIIDNSQAFYSPNIKGVDCFYSPRKFFGVPDGAYLYSKKKLNLKIKNDYSSQRFNHLIERIEKNAKNGYALFIENENSLNNINILKMSKLSQKILKSIDYSQVAKKRVDNYNFLKKNLHHFNEFSYDLKENDVPMFYPFMSYKIGLREILINNNIFIPTFWKNVYEWVGENSIEYNFTKFLLPLPIDQRYSYRHLSRIIKIIKHEYQK